MYKEKTEEHIISCYTRICWSFETESLSVHLINWKHSWPKYFYILKIINDGHLDLEYPKLSWVSKTYFTYRNYIVDLCAILTIKHWKLFEYVWILKNCESYNEIYFEQWNQQNLFLPWFKQKNRVNEAIDLNLNISIWPELSFFLDKLISDDKDLKDFLYVSNFYQKALKNSQYDIEISYIDFVRSIEIAWILYPDSLEWENIFEWDLKTIYDDLSTKELKDKFENFHGSTKKFFKKVLNQTTKDTFWSETESTWEDFWLNKLINREKSIKNIYMIRSKYIHEWCSFGSFLLPDKEWLEELTSSWDSNDKTIIIWESFTLLGLERIVREVLLNTYNLDICTPELKEKTSDWKLWL